MKLSKVIHKRKVKHIYNYIGFFCILFGVVFLSCSAVAFFVHKNREVLSPLAKWQKTVFASVESSTIQKIDGTCQQHTITCSNIQLGSDDSATFDVDGKTIIISLNKDIEQQVSSLQLTIRELTMEGKEFHRLDFRYDKPVITF